MAIQQPLPFTLLSDFASCTPAAKSFHHPISDAPLPLPLLFVSLAVEGCISPAAIALSILRSLSEACVEVCRLRPFGHALCKHSSIRNLTPSQGQAANMADSANAGAQGQHSLQAYAGNNPHRTRGASLVGCAFDGGLHCRNRRQCTHLVQHGYIWARPSITPSIVSTENAQPLRNMPDSGAHVRHL